MGKKEDKFNALRVTPAGVVIGIFSGLLLAGIAIVNGGQDDLKVGQKVTNGFCTGYISAVNSRDYMVDDAYCNGIAFNRVFMKKTDVKAAQ